MYYIHDVYNSLQILLLTDGDVFNTREVIDLVRKNASSARYVIIIIIIIIIIISGLHLYECLA